MAAQSNGTGRVALWLGIVASLVLIFGAICSFAYIGFKGQSNSDRVDALDRRVGLAEDRTAALHDRLTKMEVAQNEIETQFCAQDIVRNLMHANDMRTMSMLWEKSFGTRPPTDNAYYPTICNRKAN